MIFLLLLAVASAQPCVDSVPSCPQLSGQCHVSVVKQRCQLTCNTCVTNSPTTAAGVTPSPVKAGPVNCKDVSATSCRALANNPANYCKTNPMVPQKCPVSCGICKPPKTPAPVKSCAPPPACAATCTLRDTNGDGCNDTCTCPCPVLTCTGATVPMDTTGDGCPDKCASNCPNNGSKKLCKKAKADRCKWDKKQGGCVEQPCGGATAKNKCAKLAGCTWGLGQCYDPNQGTPTPPTVVCSTLPDKKKCNRAATCKWSTKKGGSCNDASGAPKLCIDHKKKKQCVADTACNWSGGKCADAGPVKIDCSKLSKGGCNAEPLCLYDKSRASGDRCYDPVCPLADVQAKYNPLKRTDPAAYQACVDFFENGKPGICECLKNLAIADMASLTCLAKIGETDDLATATSSCHSGTAACLGPKNVLDCATMSASQFGPCIWAANSGKCGPHNGATVPCVSADFLIDSVNSVKSTVQSQAACANVAGGNASKSDMCDCLDVFDSATAAKYAWCTLPGSKITGFEEFGKCL